MLLASALIPYVAGTAFATTASAAFLALPAVLGVRRLLSTRRVTPLERGPVERNAVLAAAVAGALGAVACADATSLGLSSFESEALEGAQLLLCFVAPVPLAAVPWMAGEVLSGQSLRQVRALLAAAAASCAASWIAYALCWAHTARHGLSPGVVVIQFAGAAIAAFSAARAYLALRGEPVADLPGAAVALERL